MIYYPLSVLMTGGYPRYLDHHDAPGSAVYFEELLGDGRNFGLHLSLRDTGRAARARGSLHHRARFRRRRSFLLILGDNIFYGHGLPDLLASVAARPIGATVFGYVVADPERYGVVEIDAKGRAISIEENPRGRALRWRLPDFIFTTTACSTSPPHLKPSARGELEITDVNRVYMEHHQLAVEIMGRGFAWLDTGTHESLLEAGKYGRDS